MYNCYAYQQQPQIKKKPISKRVAPLIDESQNTAQDDKSLTSNRVLTIKAKLRTENTATFLSEDDFFYKYLKQRHKEHLQFIECDELKNKEVSKSKEDDKDNKDKVIVSKSKEENKGVTIGNKKRYYQSYSASGFRFKACKTCIFSDVNGQVCMAEPLIDKICTFTLQVIPYNNDKCAGLVLRTTSVKLDKSF